MTARAVFGDFANAASERLNNALGRPGPGSRADDAPVVQIEELSRSLHRVVTVMARYCADAETAILHLPADERMVMRPWQRAASRSREALNKAAAHLADAPGTSRPAQARPPVPSARALDTAASALTIGRDLLHTHLATRPDGTPTTRSEWGPALTSTPLTRALIHQVASWARQIAPAGGRLAVAGAPVRGTPQARRRLNAACQWLWVLDWAVQAAHEHTPATTADLQLLHAIPVHGLQPRHLPDGTETIPSLCHGTIDTAARLRYHAHHAVSRAAWSPELTIESLRRTAGHAIVTSHNCQVLLRTLSDRAAQHRQPSLHAQLADAATAAGEARSAWLHTVRAWDTIVTDTRRTLSPAAAATADLALWTGRLAYTDPAWTPDLGPAYATRLPEHLAPSDADLTTVVTAVHHACETLTQLADADLIRLTTAGRAGRLLVPTRTLPDDFDIPHPFAPAPAFRTQPLLAAYRDAHAASLQATTQTATVAATIRAPSQILTTARDATQPASDKSMVGKHDSPQPAVPRRLAADLPGPVERVLGDLGVTQPHALQRAVAIDRAAEHLILEAATQPDRRAPSVPAHDPSASAGTAEIINHLLASGDPRAAAILQPPEPRLATEPEIEP